MEKAKVKCMNCGQVFDVDVPDGSQAGFEDVVWGSIGNVPEHKCIESSLPKPEPPKEQPN